MNQMSTNMVHSIFILQGSPHTSLQLNQGLEILSHNNQLFVFFKKLSNISNQWIYSNRVTIDVISGTIHQ